MWIPAQRSLCQSSLHLVHPPHPHLVPSERQRTEGVRCSSLPLLWTQELRTVLLQQRGHLPLTSMALYAPFAPSFVEAVLMQSVTLPSQLGSVGTSVLNLSSLLTLQFCSGRRGLSTAFSSKALLSFHSQAAAPCPPAIAKHEGFNICGTSRASWVPGTLCHSHSNLTCSPRLCSPEPLVVSSEAHTLLRVTCYLTKED